jgi:hypothetical protein
MRKLFLALLILGLVGIAGYGAYRGYISWRQRQLVKQARVYLTKSDTRNALLCLQRALRARPADAEASRRWPTAGAGHPQRTALAQASSSSIQRHQRPVALAQTA